MKLQFSVLPCFLFCFVLWDGGSKTFMQWGVLKHLQFIKNVSVYIENIHICFSWQMCSNESNFNNNKKMNTNILQFRIWHSNTFFCKARTLIIILMNKLITFIHISKCLQLISDDWTPCQFCLIELTSIPVHNNVTLSPFTASTTNMLSKRKAWLLTYTLFIMANYILSYSTIWTN